MSLKINMEYKEDIATIYKEYIATITKYLLAAFILMLLFFFTIHIVDSGSVENKEQRIKESESKIREYRSENYSEQMHYIRDNSTGICFGVIPGSPHGLGLATVDCAALTTVEILEFKSKLK